MQALKAQQPAGTAAVQPARGGSMQERLAEEIFRVLLFAVFYAQTVPVSLLPWIGARCAERSCAPARSERLCRQD